MCNSFSFHAQTFIVAIFCTLYLSLKCKLAELDIFCVDTGYSTRFIEEEVYKNLVGFAKA